MPSWLNYLDPVLLSRTKNEQDMCLFMVIILYVPTCLRNLVLFLTLQPEEQLVTILSVAQAESVSEVPWNMGLTPFSFSFPKMA